jgi:sugar (pentulose or hexulose) kinase
MTGSSDEFVLAVDCGAQSVQALLVDLAAAVGLGLRHDFSAAVGAMTRLGATFEPDPKHAPLYEELYAQVYRRMYARLRPFTQACNES